MVHNWLLYIAAFASAFAISMVATPFAKKVSEKLGAIDYPKARGMHTKPMPRLGGIAIVMGFMITVLLLYRFVNDINLRHFTGFIAGAVIIVCVGIIDDVKNLPARVKFVFQIIAALLVIGSGIRINVVMWPVTAYLQKFSGPITLIWIVGVTNAVNLIDGLDGLASSVTVLIATFFAVVAVGTDSGVAPVACAAVGCLLGFLVYNVYPAKVFMGDTGSLALGGFVASTAYMLKMPIFIVIIAFIYFIEVLSVIIQVVSFKLTGKRVFRMAPIHHHFELSGWPETKVVAIFAITTAVCCLIGLVAI